MPTPNSHSNKESQLVHLSGTFLLTATNSVPDPFLCTPLR